MKKTSKIMKETNEKKKNEKKKPFKWINQIEREITDKINIVQL